MQNLRSPKWWSLSYHSEYDSLLFRWDSMPDLPAEPPYKVVYRGVSRSLKFLPIKGLQTTFNLMGSNPKDQLGTSLQDYYDKVLDAG